MSVVGFDIGNLNCYIAIAKQGGIEVITNDDSLHGTPACVAFGSRNRSMGVAARQAVNSNFKNTIINFKHLIGRKFSDPIAEKIIPFLPCDVEMGLGGTILCKVTRPGGSVLLHPEQVLAALLSHLKSEVEATNPAISDCVVSVPFFFTDAQRRAVRSAFEIVKLKPLRVVNETTAIALAYGNSNQDLPEEAAEARRVLFLDVGHTCTQASVAAFNKGKLTMLGTMFDLSVGGMWFDGVIREQFRRDCMRELEIDPKNSSKAWFRLLNESEEVKKRMSDSEEAICVIIKNFIHDHSGNMRDLPVKMQRIEFEGLALPLFQKLRKLLHALLGKTNLNTRQIDDIEIVGGSAGIPKIKDIVQMLFSKNPKWTMNQYEDVARGAAMQCAMLSPAMDVCDYSVKDTLPYAIKLKWRGSDMTREGRVFSDGDQSPASAIYRFHSGPFVLRIKYEAPEAVPNKTTTIGVWRVNQVPKDDDETPTEVHVSIEVNGDGIFSVPWARTYKILKEENTDVGLAPAAASYGSATSLDPVPAAEKKPMVEMVKELCVEARPSYHDRIYYHVIDEKAMQKRDLEEKRRVDAKNAVEQYVYEMRDKLADQLAEYITDADADNLRAELQSTEDWLHDVGEDCETPVYEQRLASLKALGDPVVERHREFGQRTGFFDLFDTMILRAREAFDEYVAGGPAHAHIDAKDMEKVILAIEEKKGWLDEVRHKQETRPKTEAPTVFVHEVTGQHSQFENVVNPILNRPKPVPKTASAGPDGTSDAPAGSQEPAEMEMD